MAAVVEQVVLPEENVDVGGEEGQRLARGERRHNALVAAVAALAVLAVRPFWPFWPFSGVASRPRSRAEMRGGSR